jgi:hypothetical protein
MDQMKLDMRLQLNCEECGQSITSESAYQLRWHVDLFGGKDLCPGCNLPLASTYHQDDLDD